MSRKALKVGDLPQKLSYAEMIEGIALSRAGFVTPPMPKTRGDCVDGPRPCVNYSCKYHIGIDINEETGTVLENFPGGTPPETCALDIADRGGSTLEEIGEVLNVTRERVRQIELKAKTRMLAKARDLGIDLRDLFAYVTNRRSGHHLALAQDASSGSVGVAELKDGLDKYLSGKPDISFKGGRKVSDGTQECGTTRVAAAEVRGQTTEDRTGCGDTDQARTGDRGEVP